MKNLLIAIWLLSTTVLFSQQKIKFERIKSMPNEAYAFAASSSNRDIYSLAGGDDWNSFTSYLQIYDTKVDLWIKTPLEDLPITSNSSALYMEEYHGIVTLGGTQPYGGDIALVEQIRMVNLDDFSVSVLGPNPEAARNMGLAKDGRTIYFFGGSTQGSPIFKCSNKLFSYDLSTGHLQMLPDMPYAMETEGAVVNGNLYVFGGYNRTSRPNVYKFNIKDNEWTELDPLDKPLSNYSITQFEKYIILVGDHTLNDQMIIYDTESEKAEYYKMKNVRARSLGAAVSGEHLYVYGGINPRPRYVRVETYRFNIKEFLESRAQ